MVDIKRKKSAYHGQDKVQVSSRGGFRVGPFTQGGNALNPGTYTLEITVPFAQVQPASVQALIVGRGEKLQGPLVKKEELGNNAVYHSTFKVAGAESAEKDKIARQQYEKERQEHGW